MNQEKEKSKEQKASDEPNFLEEDKETANQKYKRIATEKCESISKNIIWLLSSPKQPSYDVTPENAKKIINFFENYTTLIKERYIPISEGKKINKIKNLESKKLFNEEVEP